MPRRGSVLTGALAALALVLTGSTPALAIADGDPVAEGHYRFAVKFRMTNIPRPDGTTYDSACSGSLIAPQWVITAGHCFHDVNRLPVSGPVPYTTTATIGRTDDADTNGHVVSVIEDYQAPAGDIAIAKLAVPVLDIVPLVPADHPPAVGDVLRITGWGSLSDVDPKPASHLQTGQVKVTSISTTVIGVVGYLPQPTTSGCLYDSGAPYITEKPHLLPQLVSVESDGPSCPHSQEETTARIDPVLHWIKQTEAAHATS